jgi:hypothetical protein
VSLDPEAQRRAAARGSTPIRVYRLGDAPGDDLTDETTAVQRLEMMWPLALEAWALTGQRLPVYGRGQTPVTRRPWTVRS